MRKTKLDQPITEAQENLSRNLRWWRDHKDMVPEKIADLAEGVSRSSIYNMIRMDADPSIGTVAKVAKALDRTASELLASESDEDEIWEVIRGFRKADRTGKDLILLVVRGLKASS